MCTYINFFRTSLRSADSKCQISHRWSKNGSECTGFCAPKVIQEVNFPKSFLSHCIQDGLQLCTYIVVFLFGVRWRHNRAPNLKPRFWSISYQFEEGSRGQLCIDLYGFSLFVRGPDVLSNALNVSQFRRQVAPQDSQICGRNFQKRKKSAAELCQILRMVTVEIVINSTRVMGVRVTISCRYALSFGGRCFCFQFRLKPVYNLLSNPACCSNTKK